ncbi:MAG: flavin reductase family protein [Rhodospirillaceae bacterium]|nr:flavin reductase family protein [Rhodospirillaceae bacterium]
MRHQTIHPPAEPGTLNEAEVRGTAVPPAEFRSVMSAYTTGVCIACSLDEDGAPSGLTVNSFTSVSLVPPIVSLCIGLGSRTLMDFRRAGVFAVNILAVDQIPLAQACAARELNWEEVALTTWETRAPIISRAVAALDCRIVADHEAGDHAILLGQAAKVGWLRRDVAVLTYHRGRYGTAPPELEIPPGA